MFLFSFLGGGEAYLYIYTSFEGNQVLLSTIVVVDGNVGPYD